MKKSTHSKLKNTAILFELLTRQIAADTMCGVDNSPALHLIKSFFKKDSILAKELMLYQTLINERFSTPQKAEYLINTVTKLQRKLNATLLKEEKYRLIREIKKQYDIVQFFKTSVNNYKLCASIYRIFEGVTVARLSEVVKSRFTIVENITRAGVSKKAQAQDESIGIYLKQDKDIRLLAYKLMLDKFNEKYMGLSAKQKNILKEYINNISNTTALNEFLIAESEIIRGQIAKLITKVTDKVTVIKLNEVCNMLSKFKKVKTIKEEHVLSLLLYHELLKELKGVK